MENSGTASTVSSDPDALFAADLDCIGAEYAGPVELSASAISKLAE